MIFIVLYPSYFKLHVRWLRSTRPIHGPRPYGQPLHGVQICSRQICRSPRSLAALPGLAPSGPAQALFTAKVPCPATRIIEGILSLCRVHNQIKPDPIRVKVMGDKACFLIVDRASCWPAAAGCHDESHPPPDSHCSGRRLRASAPAPAARPTGSCAVRSNR